MDPLHVFFSQIFHTNVYKNKCVNCFYLQAQDLFPGALHFAIAFYNPLHSAFLNLV